MTLTDGEGADGVLWADVGERLSLTVREMRSIRAAFGDVFGFGSSRTVPEDLLPAIDYVARQRAYGASDSDIRRELSAAKDEAGWPEEVLSRMETAAAVSRRAPMAVRSPPVPLPDPGPAPVDPEEPQILAILSGPAEDTVLAELRREMNTQFAADRECLYRLDQAVRRLATEVRDMRYALMLGFTRKDRKKGHKGMSNLLIG